MKIVVTSVGATLDDQIDPAFARCSYFLFVETDDLSFEAVENQYRLAGIGTGIECAKWVAEKGVQTVLTGICKPNAYLRLQAAGVEVIKGVSGEVKAALEQFKAGELSPYTKEQELDWLKKHLRVEEKVLERNTERIQGLKSEVKKT